MKNLHQFLAILTISGFVLRSHWALRSSPMLQHRITRIAPHVVDTLFLVTGIVLILQLRLPILQTGWLMAKLAGLVVYIVLGALTLRPGRSERARLLAFTGAMLAFAYVVNTAITKSVLPWSG
jgi:uncharacterized membrane protein SirB2